MKKQKQKSLTRYVVLYEDGEPVAVGKGYGPMINAALKNGFEIVDKFTYKRAVKTMAAISRELAGA